MVDDFVKDVSVESNPVFKPKPKSWLDSFTGASKIPLIIVLGIIIITGVLVALFNYHPSVDSNNRFGNSSYCIEWANSISLESIPVQCFDWKSNSFGCAWIVHPDTGILEVVARNVSNGNFYNVSNFFNCTRFVKTEKIS